MEGEWNQHCRFSRTPNKRLHQTDHANKGSACCDAFSRVSRLLSLVDYEAVGMSTTCLPFFRFSYILRRFNVCLGASCLRSSRNREGAGGRHVSLLSWTTSLRRMEDTMTAVPVEPLTQQPWLKVSAPTDKATKSCLLLDTNASLGWSAPGAELWGGKSSDPDDIAQNVFVVVYLVVCRTSTGITLPVGCTESPSTKSGTTSARPGKGFAGTPTQACSTR